eukprot:COSAG02_NODE_40834_length_401_cov_0.678808_2_plen_41_part_01
MKHLGLKQSIRISGTLPDLDWRTASGIDIRVELISGTALPP